MMTFILAAAVLVGALLVAATLDDVAAGRPPNTIASHVVAAPMLAAYCPAPVDGAMVCLASRRCSVAAVVSA